MREQRQGGPFLSITNTTLLGITGDGRGRLHGLIIPADRGFIVVYNARRERVDGDDGGVWETGRVVGQAKTSCNFHVVRVVRFTLPPSSSPTSTTLSSSSAAIDIRLSLDSDSKRYIRPLTVLSRPPSPPSHPAP